MSSNMGPGRIGKHEEFAPARSRALVPAAVAGGLLWFVVVLATGYDARAGLLTGLAAAGVVATVGLLLLIQAQHVQLSSVAATDALTRLLNHRSFHERLRTEVERARLTNAAVVLIVIDLDNFRAVNDKYGYQQGDEVLRGVGETLQRTVRDGDTAARIGGEDFALILPGATGEEAFAISERAREAVAAAAPWLELSCSAGIAVFPVDASDAATLMQLADSALHSAKRAGKQRTRRFDPDRATHKWTNRQHEEIAELLENERSIVPVFQPVVSLATGRVVGYEALARLPSAPNRSPDVWFAQAHGLGLGAELEAAAIAAATAPLGQPLDTHLAVNVSPSALSSEPVQKVLSGDVSGMVVEITEHEYVADDEILAVAVADLRRRGARIALDDAGAGHAGLRQLMAVRPDIVKLDRTLTKKIHSDPALVALVESFVRFARDVGATVCAEGIEGLDDLAVLADLDVEWGQGYVLGRPAPPWAPVDRVAAEVCRATLAESFRSMPAVGSTLGSSDRRLVHLSAILASAHTRSDLQAALMPIAAELGASVISLSTWNPERGVLETLAASGQADAPTTFAVSEYSLTEEVLREQKVAQVLVGDPDSDPAEADLLLQLGERSLLMVPVVAAGKSLDHRGLQLGRAPLDAHGDQPRAGDREPVRVRDPDVRRRLERPTRAELASHRLRAAPHLHDLGPALVHVADDELTADALIIEELERPLHRLSGGRVTEAVGDVDPPVPVGLRVGLRVDLGHQHRGVDVLALVGETQVADDVGPVAGERVEDRLEVLGESHSSRIVLGYGGPARRRCLRGDQHAIGERAADRMGCAVDDDHHRPAERLPIAHRDPRSGADLPFGQITEHRRVGIRNASEGGALPRLELVQGEGARLLCKRELTVGDRVAVGVVAGIAEHRRDAFLEILGDVVLEDLSLVVDSVPWHVERLGEKRLDQPVMSDHLERHALA
jgi:diguanylate cyclase (GGDEF)-like protein